MILMSRGFIVTSEDWKRRLHMNHEGRSLIAPSDLEHLECEDILVLGPDLRPQVANRAAQSMLGFHSDPLPRRVPSEEVLTLVRRAREGAGWMEESIQTWFPRRRNLRVGVSPLEGDRTLVILHDVTEEVLARRVRREFVSHASHELKSPVASLQALAEALAQATTDDPASAGRFADRMMAESERLGRLVTDLLDLSRLEDLDSTPADPVELSAVARLEVEDIQSVATAKRIEITTEITDGIWIRGDEQQISALVRNLIDNAVRYSHEESEVYVRAFPDHGEAVVEVRDRGIGIATEAQERVFERFYRVDRARSRDRGGTGLGLSIVKHVAELHGGIVELESELGRGSIFTARVPAVPPRPQRIASAG